MRITFTCLLAILFSITSIAQSTTTEVLNHDGLDRNYIVHTPPNFNPTDALPLLIVLHGLGDTGNGIMSGTGFNSIADQENFVVVYPDAESSLIGTAWNNGTPIPLFDVDDLGFISALIDYMNTEYEINSNRVYVCGFSMGGIMSHRLACEMPEKITAIASMAGVMATSVIPNCNPERAVPVLHMHGDADATVPYEGNSLLGLSSVSQTIETWVTNNNCNATPINTPLPDTANDGYTIDIDQYGLCADAVEVCLYTIHNGPHTWLQPNNDIYTSQEMWDFFNQYEISDEPTDIVELSNEKDWEIYPNPTSDILHIKAGNEIIISSRIVDLLGHEWTRNSGHSESIDVSMLPRGLYLIQIQTSKGNQITKPFSKL